MALGIEEKLFFGRSQAKTHNTMAKTRKTTQRQNAAAEAPGRAWTAVVGAACLGYALLFYLLPVQELEGQSRAAMLWQYVLVPEGFVSWWFGDPPQFALADRLSVLSVAAALWCVCALAGWLVMGGVRADRGLSRLETLFFSCCVGFSVVSLYTLGIGLLGLLHFRWMLFLPALGVILGAACRAWRLTRVNVRESDALWDDKPEWKNDRTVRWLWFALPFAAVILLGGALPPIDFDVREYHLQVPKEFFLSGRIGFLPDNAYGNMPLASEIVSLAAMVAVDDWWFGALVGKAMIAGCALVTALGLFTAGRRYFGPKAGVVAALVYLSIPWVARVSVAGLIEGVSALYLWAAVYAVLLWNDADQAGASDSRTPDQGGKDARPPGIPRALLAGFLAGSAVACKYPAAVFVLLPLGTFVAARSLRSGVAVGRGGSFVARLAPVVLFTLAAAAACGPWFAKNWVLTGNPTYPLLYGIFDGRTRTTELDDQWRRAHRPDGYGPRELVSAVNKFALQSPWQSVLVLPLGIAGVAWNRRRPMIVALSVYAAFVLAAWWLLTHRIDRFWVPVLPVLAFLGGVVLAAPLRREPRVAIGLFLGLGIAANWIFIAAGAADDAYFVSTARLRTDPQRVDPWHLYLNEHVPHDAAVLAVGDAQVFDLSMPVFYSTVFDPNLFESLMKGRSPEERRRELSDRNVAFVYVHWGEIARYLSPGNYGFTEYVTPGLFETLVSQQVLAAPLPMIEGHLGQVFPVHRGTGPAAR
ncbi:MAG: hypothetical protein HYX69_08175 [Planctomycetia bacterium]|nr:hypothetical protein [Planctomycetia bacterium]